MVQQIKPKLEKDIQREICDYLALKGYFFWRSNNIPVFDKGKFRAMPKYSLKGLPDIQMLHNGKYIGLEIKRQVHTNKKTNSYINQLETGKNIMLHGGMWYMVKSLDEFITIVEKDL